MKKSVFRIVKKIQEFSKAQYKTLEKKTLKQVHPVVYSIAHQADNVSQFNLPLKRTALKALNKSNAVILIDSFLEEDEIDVPETQVKLFELNEHPFPVEIFSFKEEEGIKELWLNYSRNSDFIGEPERGDFYIMSFKINEPVIFRINGTKEFSSKGKRERIYLEHFYYIEWLGEQDVIPVKREKQLFKVRLHLSEAKEINLRKLFY